MYTGSIEALECRLPVYGPCEKTLPLELLMKGTVTLRTRITPRQANLLIRRMRLVAVGRERGDLIREPLFPGDEPPAMFYVEGQAAVPSSGRGWCGGNRYMFSVTPKLLLSERSVRWEAFLPTLDLDYSLIPVHSTEIPDQELLRVVAMTATKRAA